MDLQVFPTLNAFLNGLSAALLVSGYRFIRRRLIREHQACMVGAVLVSLAFLISYLYYHYHAGATRFAGPGWSKIIYYPILLSHTVLATAIVPLVFVTLVLALANRFNSHRRVARWAFPVWLYVSITGVLVYLMLYHLFPSA